MTTQLERPTATPVQRGEAPDDITAGISVTNERFVVAVAGGDADAIADVYTPDAKLLAPDVQLLAGRAAIREYWAAGIAAGIRGVTLETVSIERAGDVAIEIGGFVLRLAAAGQAESAVHGKYVVVHRRGVDGTWRWQTDCFNTNGSAG